MHRGGPKGVMKDKIVETLETIEEFETVRILYAAEVGSHAWGFASEKSDWDVRFIYVRSLDRYLSLSGQPDTIDAQTSLREHTRHYIIGRDESDNIDLAGWDIKKTLHLMSKGNPLLAEIFNSPMVYHSVRPFSSTLKDKVLTRYYSDKAGIYYYWHMAKDNFEQYIVHEKLSEVSFKKYLHVIRPLLAMMWIKTYNTPPPLNMLDMAKELKLSADRMRLVVFARDLIERKKTGDELGNGPKNDLIDGIISEILIEYGEHGRSTLARLPSYSMEEIDDLCYQIITNLAPPTKKNTP